MILIYNANSQTFSNGVGISREVLGRFLKRQVECENGALLTTAISFLLPSQSNKPSFVVSKDMKMVSINQGA